MSTSTTRYVALLRGINVGKAKQVDMTRLRKALTARGHEEVLTHLRSGNVVLTSGLSEQALAAELQRERQVLEGRGRKEGGGA